MSKCSEAEDNMSLDLCGCSCSHSGQNLYLRATPTLEVFSPIHAIAEFHEVAPVVTDHFRNIKVSFRPLRFESLQNQKSVLLLI